MKNEVTSTKQIFSNHSKPVQKIIYHYHQYHRIIKEVAHIERFTEPYGGQSLLNSTAG